MSQECFDDLLDEEATASILKIEKQTLRKWRCQKKGSDYIKIGHIIRYAANDIKNFLETQKVKLN